MLHIIDLPVEIIEKILLYLNMKDLSSWFSVIEHLDNTVSNLFWKKVCKRDSFIPDECKSWEDIYWASVNLKLCRYKFKQHCMENIPVHLFDSALISSSKTHTPIQIWNIIGNELVFAHHLPPGRIIAYNGTLAVHNSDSVAIYQFDNAEKVYSFYTNLKCSYEDMIRMGNKLMVIYSVKLKEFLIFNYSENNQFSISRPDDISFLLSIRVDENRLFIVVITFSGSYKIKVFDTVSKLWTVDIICFDSVCSTRNDPQIWVNPYYIVSTNMSFRGQNLVVYDDLAIYKSDGTLIRKLDLESSRRCYFYCCFSIKTIIVTRSQNRIAVIKENDIYEFDLIDDQYKDIRLAPGHILIASYKTHVQTYDWKYGELLYSVDLSMFAVDQIFFNSYFFIAYSPIECTNVSILNFTGNQITT